MLYLYTISGYTVFFNVKIMTTPHSIISFDQSILYEINRQWIFSFKYKFN